RRIVPNSPSARFCSIFNRKVRRFNDELYKWITSSNISGLMGIDHKFWDAPRYSYLAKDGLHPNYYGIDKMAENIKEQASKILKNSSYPETYKPYKEATLINDNHSTEETHDLSQQPSTWQKPKKTAKPMTADEQ